jgi:hypothetical protein
VDWWIGGLVVWWFGGLVNWWFGGLVNWWFGELAYWQIRRLFKIHEGIDPRKSAIPQFLAKNLRNRLICVPDKSERIADFR